MAVRRILGVLLIALGCYVASTAVAVGISIGSMLLEGPWLGPEPELLIPVAGILAAGFIIWTGVRVLRSGPGA